MSVYTWSEVLTSIEAALGQALAQAAVPEPPVEPPPASERLLQVAQEHQIRRARHWDAVLKRAEQTTTAVDQELQQAEDGLRRWLAQAEQLRGNLAIGGPSILK